MYDLKAMAMLWPDDILGGVLSQLDTCVYCVFQSPSEPRPPEQPATSSRLYEKAWLVLKWYNVDAKYP